jgi:hypothetical protein
LGKSNLLAARLEAVSSATCSHERAWIGTQIIALLHPAPRVNREADLIVMLADDLDDDAGRRGTRAAA